MKNRVQITELIRQFSTSADASGKAAVHITAGRRSDNDYCILGYVQELVYRTTLCDQ